MNMRRDQYFVLRTIPDSKRLHSICEPATFEVSRARRIKLDDAPYPRDGDADPAGGS